MAAYLLLSRVCVFALLVTWVGAASLSGSSSSGHSQQEVITCLQPDGACSCLTNQGLVDLSPMEIGHDIPRVDLIDTEPGGVDNFTFSPCTAFTQGGPHTDCQSVQVCQLSRRDTSSGGQYHGLGVANSVSWDSDPENKRLVLTLLQTGADAVTRRSSVTLVCDEDAQEDKMVAFGEGPELVYTFELVSRHVCPVSVTTPDPPPVYCVEPLDSCSCITNQGLIDLSGVEDGFPVPRYNLVDSPDPEDRFSYSPCTSFTQPGVVKRQGQGHSQTTSKDQPSNTALNGTSLNPPWYDCNNVLVCQHHEFDRPDGGDFWGVGDASSVTWTENPDADRAVMLHYEHLGDDGTVRSSDVTLICDEDEEGDVLIIRGETQEGHFEFDLISSHACPRPYTTTPPTTTPEPALVCLEPSGPCRCRTDQGIVDLSGLEVGSPIPSFSLVGTTPPGLDRFSYSPCSTFSQGPVPRDDTYYDCHDVLVCQNHEFERPDGGDFWGVGGTQDISWVNDPHADGALMLRYQHEGFDQTVRTSEITLLCDEQAAPDAFIAYGEVELNLFKFDLVSRHACPQEEVSTPDPPTGPPPVRCVEPQGACSCQTDQGLIDLRAVEVDHDVPRFNFTDTTPLSQDQFSYSPCTPFTQGPDADAGDCSDVLMCQLSRTDIPSGGQYYGLGRTNSVTWYNDPAQNEALIVSYSQTGIDGIHRITRVTLVCDEDEAGAYLVAFGETDLIYTGQSACVSNTQ